MDMFSQRLKYFRLKAGYSQKELADIVGISVSTYNNYETRNYEPKIEILIKLANALSIDVNRLVGYIPKINEAEYARNILKNYEETDDCIFYTYLPNIDFEKNPALNYIENTLNKYEKFKIHLTKDEFNRFINRAYDLARQITNEESDKRFVEYFRIIINRMIFSHYYEYDYLQQQKK